MALVGHVSVTKSPITLSLPVKGQEKDTQEGFSRLQSLPAGRQGKEGGIWFFGVQTINAW
jgi:hypothetical protein